MFSRNSYKNHSSSFRVSWSLGNRKKHHKGHHEPHSAVKISPQKEKRYDVWSVNGIRSQKDLTSKPELSKSLMPNGESATSSKQVSPKVYPGKAEVANKPPNGARPASTSGQVDTTALLDNSTENTEHDKTSSPTLLDPVKEYANSSEHTTTSPNSTASTAPLESPAEDIDGVSVSISEELAMPSRSHSVLPEVNSAATTADIMDDNRFSILDKSSIRNDFDVYTLPSPPTSFSNSEDNLTSQSRIVATAQETPSPSPRKHNVMQNGIKHYTSYSNKAHPQNQNHHYNNAIHNHNQGDVNSIESITEDTLTTDMKMTELLQDDLDSHEDTKVVSKTKRKRKKKYANVKELDQLDGVHQKGTIIDTPKEENERVVECLYYTLMCCDCTIS